MWINFSQHNPRSNKWRHALTLKSKSFPERWFDRENEELQQPRKTGNNNWKMTKNIIFHVPSIFMMKVNSMCFLQLYLANQEKFLKRQMDISGKPYQRSFLGGAEYIKREEVRKMQKRNLQSWKFRVGSVENPPISQGWGKFSLTGEQKMMGKILRMGLLERSLLHILKLLIKSAHLTRWNWMLLLLLNHLL